MGFIGNVVSKEQGGQLAAFLLGKLLALAQELVSHREDFALLLLGEDPDAVVGGEVLFWGRLLFNGDRLERAAVQAHAAQDAGFVHDGLFILNSEGVRGAGFDAKAAAHAFVLMDF